MSDALAEKAGREFDQRLLQWCESSPVAAVRPRSAVETARLVLEASETVRVETIDAFFNSLARQFAPELGFPPEAAIADQLTVKELQQQAWHELSRLICENENLRQEFNDYLRLSRGRGFQQLRGYSEQLHRQRAELEAYHFTPDAALEKLKLPEPDIDQAAGDFYREVIDVLEALRRDPAFSPYREKFGPTLTAAVEALRQNQPLTAIVALLWGNKLLKKIDFGSYNCPDNFTISKQKMARAEIKALIDILNDRLADALRPYRQARLIPGYNRTISMLRSLYRRYARIYEGLKTRQKLMEFSDLGLAALRLWRDERWPGIRFHLLSGIRHLLLDEFQDTSRLQWEVFRLLLDDALLAGDSIFGDFSLFMVGDEKQSIYGFRNADYRVLADAGALVTRHPRVVSHPLNESFRSSNLVLDFINRVFGGLNARHGEEIIPFQPHSRHPEAWPLEGGSVNLYPPFCDHQEEGSEEKQYGLVDEARFVAAKISRLLTDPRPLIRTRENGQIVQRRVRPGDITVLYRTRKGVSRLLDELCRLKVPVVREDQGGFFQQPEIRDCLALVFLLADRDDELALLRLLRSPLNRMPEAAFHNLLREKLARPDINLLDQYLAKSKKSPLARALTATVINNRELPLAQRCALFLEITAAQRCYRGRTDDPNPAANLDRFLSLLSGNGYRSAVEARTHLLKLSGADELSGSLGQQQDAVRLMTVHRAKGLQNEIIFLFNTATSDRQNAGLVINRSSSRHDFPILLLPSSREDLPPVDFLEEMKAINQRESFGEEIRVLYVALTRAAQHLFITANTRKAGEMPETIAVMEEALRTMAADDTDLTGKPCLAGIQVPHGADDADKPEPEETAAPGTAREKIILEPEALRSFRRQKRKAPSSIEELTETAVGGGASDRLLGLIVHRVLEEELKGLEPSLAAICRGWAPVERAEEYCSRAAEMLDLIKKTDDFQELKRNAAMAEVPIAGWTADGTYIPGRLDALSLAGRRATALDFKTGEVNRSQMELYRQLLAEIFPHGRLAAVQPAEKSKESGKTYEEEW
jgi:ATP-dependent helicase/nuclease subunit A